MDHLGVEVSTTEQVQAAATRLAGVGLATAMQENATCCYAVQDNVWATALGNEAWEIYTVLADDRPELEGRTGLAVSAVAGDDTCC